MTIWPTVIELNRAVAVAMADGPAAGLALVEQLEEPGKLAGYHLLPATRADLLRRLNRREEAALAYRQALELAATEPERRYLARRLSEMTRRWCSSTHLDERVHLLPVRSSVGRPTHTPV